MKVDHEISWQDSSLCPNLDPDFTNGKTKHPPLIVDDLFWNEFSINLGK